MARTAKTKTKPSLANLTPPPRKKRPESLTSREQEILELIWAGFKNKEIGQRLKISVKTVIRKFENRSGVLNLGSERQPTKKGKREKYAILRIPQAALTAFITEKVQ